MIYCHCVIVDHEFRSYTWKKRQKTPNVQLAHHVVKDPSHFLDFYKRHKRTRKILFCLEVSCLDLPDRLFDWFLLLLSDKISWEEKYCEGNKNDEVDVEVFNNSFVQCQLIVLFVNAGWWTKICQVKNLIVTSRYFESIEL